MNPGRILLGLCDQVPGRFYVATEFVHLFYFPFIPRRSYVIVDGSEMDISPSSVEFAGTFEGREISLSGKSVLLAYVRGVLVLGLIGALLYLGYVIFRLLAGWREWAELAGGAALPAAFGLALKASYVLSKAGARRAAELADLLGHSP